MPKENAPELFGLFHYIHQLSDEAKRGMKTSLEECPRCHFVMLEGVLANIARNGWKHLCFRPGRCRPAADARRFAVAAPAGAGWTDRTHHRLERPPQDTGSRHRKRPCFQPPVRAGPQRVFRPGGAPPDAPAAGPAAGAEGCPAGCGDGRKCGIPDQIEGRQSKWVRSSSSWPATGPPAWS